MSKNRDLELDILAPEFDYEENYDEEILDFELRVPEEEPDLIDDHQKKEKRTYTPRVQNKPCESNPILKKLAEEVDWKQVSQRIRAYRIVTGMSKIELAEKCGLRPGAISNLEAGHDRKTANYLWTIASSQNISIKWLFLGEGKFSDENPPELMPTTIIQERGAGIRKTQERIDADEGQFTDDPFDFILAIDAYKSANNINFVSWTDALMLLKALGYRKVEKPSINPRRASSMPRKEKQ